MMDIFGRRARREYIEALMMDAKAWKQKAEASDRRFEEYLRWDERRRREATPMAVAGAKTHVTQHTPVATWEFAREQTKEYLRLAGRFADLSDYYGGVRTLIGRKLPAPVATKARKT